jgi:hypothetical protein
MDDLDVRGLGITLDLPAQVTEVHVQVLNRANIFRSPDPL